LFWSGSSPASWWPRYGRLRGSPGWLNYLAVAPQFRARDSAENGGGSRIAVAEKGCPKINVQIAPARRGDRVLQENRIQADEVVSMGKRLETDE